MRGSRASKSWDCTRSPHLLACICLRWLPTPKEVPRPLTALLCGLDRAWAAHESWHRRWTAGPISPTTTSRPASNPALSRRLKPEAESRIDAPDSRPGLMVCLGFWRENHSPAHVVSTYSSCSVSRALLFRGATQIRYSIIIRLWPSPSRQRRSCLARNNHFPAIGCRLLKTSIYLDTRVREHSLLTIQLTKLPRAVRDKPTMPGCYSASPNAPAVVGTASTSRCTPTSSQAAPNKDDVTLALTSSESDLEVEMIYPTCSSRHDDLTLLDTHLPLRSALHLASTARPRLVSL